MTIETLLVILALLLFFVALFVVTTVPLTTIGCILLAISRLVVLVRRT